MKVIGLTGPSGAGKGIVAAYLLDSGYPHINCDKIYHSLLESHSESTLSLVARFGEGILDKNGAIDRKKLADLVFTGHGHKKRLDDLNSITHGFVLKECRNLIQKYREEGKKAVVVDAPTLIESGFDAECDLVLVVNAPYETRLKRIIERDRITPKKAAERLSAQKDDLFYTERADFLIENSSTLDDIRTQIEKFIREKLN